MMEGGGRGARLCDLVTGVGTVLANDEMISGAEAPMFTAIMALTFVRPYKAVKMPPNIIIRMVMIQYLGERA